MMPLIKKRLDYRPLQWLPKDTYLEILIFNDFTIVKSKILFKKNKSDLINSYRLDNTIELNGINLITNKFLLIIDGLKTESIKIDSLKKDNEVVSIPVPINAHCLKILTSVIIFKQ